MVALKCNSASQNVVTRINERKKVHNSLATSRWKSKGPRWGRATRQRVVEADLLSSLCRDEAGRHGCERLTLHGVGGRDGLDALVTHAIVLQAAMGEDRWPRADVDIFVLEESVVLEQGKEVFPALQIAKLANRSDIDDVMEAVVARVRLSKDDTLESGWLPLSSQARQFALFGSRVRELPSRPFIPLSLTSAVMMALLM